MGFQLNSNAMPLVKSVHGMFHHLILGIVESVIHWLISLFFIMENVSVLVQLVPGIMPVNILVQNVIQNVWNVICSMEISVQVVTLIVNGRSWMDRRVSPNVLLVNMEIGSQINVCLVKLLVKAANRVRMIAIVAILNQHRNSLWSDSVKISVILDILFL